MSDTHENGSPNVERNEAAAAAEHLNIKVTDNNNEVFFKIKRSTKLEKLMNAFCERQGKSIQSVRFLFEGQRVQPTDTPDTVRIEPRLQPSCHSNTHLSRVLHALAACVALALDAASLHPKYEANSSRPAQQLEMQDGDTLEVHQEQVGGGL